eukprot:INCI14397.1.p1 GENE.INCI14397.1~~INCI14397.1.p1  ORF type:complete len:453 (+),score=59.65 INCI14397.1:290-1648(+)
MLLRCRRVVSNSVLRSRACRRPWTTVCPGAFTGEDSGAVRTLVCDHSPRPTLRVACSPSTFLNAANAAALLHRRLVSVSQRHTSSAPHESFDGFPYLGSVKSLIRKARDSVRSINPDISLRNPLQRKKKHMVQQVLAFGETMQRSLKEYSAAFQARYAQLHDYEKLMFEVALSNGQKRFRKKGYTVTTLPDLQTAIQRLQSEITSLSSHQAKLCKASKSLAEATQVFESSLELLPGLLDSNRRVVEFTDEILFQLRRMPVIDFQRPVVVVVGMPNVGKSSLVRALSSGRPEVQNYPFTTRTIISGHISVSENSSVTPFQILDTPGILPRQRSGNNLRTRNDMEKLTIASIEVLDSVVLYVMDMSGFSQPVDEQLSVWTELKSTFGDRAFRWVDVVSKTDLIDPMLLDQVKAATPNAIFTSSETGEGIPAVHSDIVAALLDAEHVLGDKYDPS